MSNISLFLETWMVLSRAQILITQFGDVPKKKHCELFKYFISLQKYWRFLEYVYNYQIIQSHNMNHDWLSEIKQIPSTWTVFVCLRFVRLSLIIFNLWGDFFTLDIRFRLFSRKCSNRTHNLMINNRKAVELDHIEFYSWITLSVGLVITKSIGFSYG